MSYANAQDKPNIILIFPDNLGIGEVASFGGARGVPTPNIDRIGNEGMRLTNFNVEYSCTPSRIAIMTGRYAARAGEDYYAGTTLWEETMAEGLKSAGYATALFGKWDLGGPNWLGKREPTDQGFDKWYGIPYTTHISQFSSMEGFPSDQPIPYIWEGEAGAPSNKVKAFDLEARRTLDREAAEHVIAFMNEKTKEQVPFFIYYPMSQLHFPALPHPDKAGSTGAGDVGDSMADVDYNVGLILKELERLNIDDNTIVIWCSDNGAEMRRPWRGNPGPWRGYYNTAMEGGIRTPFVIRWPKRIKGGQVSNEVVHLVDLFPTIAAAAGVPSIIPNDRIIDGVNQLAFLEGKQSNSNRESVIFMERYGNIMAVKWHNWKLWYRYETEMPDPNPDNLIRLFDLGVDPKEEIDVKDFYPWVISTIDKVVEDYEASLIMHPKVTASANAVDPYSPPPAGSGEPVATYTRTDRDPLRGRSLAIENPDFTGSWSTAVLQTVSAINRIDAPSPPSLGSGWGDKITIIQKENEMKVERVFFTPREMQQLLKYRFKLDGSTTEQMINLGRTEKSPISKAVWDNNRLVITTEYESKNPANGKKQTGTLTQTMWLQSPTISPWEPTLIVETTRRAGKGGKPSTNRTEYTRGYR